MAKAVLTAIKLYLWHFMPQMIPVALFSNNVDPSEKLNSVHAVKEDGGIVRNTKQLNTERKRILQSRSILANATSTHFLNIVGLDKTPWKGLCLRRKKLNRSSLA